MSLLEEAYNFNCIDRLSYHTRLLKSEIKMVSIRIILLENKRIKKQYQREQLKLNFLRHFLQLGDDVTDTVLHLVHKSLIEVL